MAFGTGLGPREPDGQRAHRVDRIGAIVAIPAKRLGDEPGPHPEETGKNDDPGRAFSFTTALVFASTITAVVFVSAAIVAWLGAAGLIPAAAVTGFADAHATAVSVGSLVAADRIQVAEGALPILLGVQLVLGFLSFDMHNTPRQPIHRRLEPRR